MTVPPAWSAEIAAWTMHLRASATSESTIAIRGYQLSRAAVLAPCPRQVTGEQLVQWLGVRPWKPNTKRAYRATLRGFYGWGVMTSRFEVNPAVSLPRVKVPRARPRPAPEDVFWTAVAQADGWVRLALLLGGVCGLRRGEIACAQREDVTPTLLGPALCVVGKGGHERHVPLPPLVAEAIARCGPGWLFPSPARPGEHLTPAHLSKVVSSHLPGDLTTHSLRHRCGTVAYGRTHDLRAVQELLGHAKPETTAIYTEVPGSAIRSAVDAAAA